MSILSLVRHIWVVGAVLLLLIGGGFWIGHRSIPPATKVEGAVTIRRLRCEPGHIKDSYTIYLAAQNTTFQSLHDLDVELSAGTPGSIVGTHKYVETWPRADLLEIKGEIKYPRPVEVCFARFFTRSPRQPIPAVYRP